MRITSRNRVDDAMRPHAQAETPLLRWVRVVEAATWRNLKDVRQAFPHADIAKVSSGQRVVVFNIGGNNYRLVATVSYPLQAVNVLAVLTHAEYDKEKWKQTL